MRTAFLLLMAATLLSGCRDQARMTEAIERAEDCLWTAPDTTRCVLENMPPDKWRVTPAVYARYHLLLAQARSRLKDTRGNDSLLHEAWRYYGRLPFMKPKQLRMRCQLYTADYLLDRDSLEAAATHLKAAEYLTDAGTPVPYRCLLYGSLGYLNRKNRQYVQALGYYSRSVRLAAMAKDSVWMLNDLSSMLNIPGYDTTRIAQDYPNDFLRTHVCLLPQHLQGKLWQNLGVWYKDHGRPDLTEACFRSALAADSTLTSTRLTLAKLHESRGEYTTADSLYRYITTQGNFYHQSVMWHQLYLRACRQGEPDTAFRYLKQYELYRDSMYSTRDFARIQTIQARYDRQALETRLWKTKFYGMAVIGLLVGIIILVRYILSKDLENQKRQVKDGRIRYSLLLDEKENLTLSLLESEKSINRYKVIYQIPAHEMYIEKKDLKSFNFYMQLKQPEFCYETERHNPLLTHWCDLLYDGFAEKLGVLFPVLTPGDMDICCLVRMGYTLEGISRLCHSNEDTIRKRMQRMYKTFGVSTRQEFIRKISSFM